MGKFSPEYRKWSEITHEAMHRYAREGIPPGQLFTHHSVIIFEDTLTIVDRDEPHLPTWWGRPDRFPWVRVRLHSSVVLPYGHGHLPNGTRVDARVLWRPDGDPLAILLKPPTREASPPEPEPPLRRRWLFKR